MVDDKLDELLRDLNPEQVEAVTHGQGPLLIIAGAGTGKTRVIAHRIAWLVLTKQARPEQILALTFTEKAAAEMEERVDLMLPYGLSNINIGTFHAFGEKVLREHALEIGLTSDFQILSEPEQTIFFRQHLFQFPLERYRPLGDPLRHIGAFLKVISRAKDEDISAEEYLSFVQQQEDACRADPENAELSELTAMQRVIAGTYDMYENLKASEGKVDFGDLVILPLRLLRQQVHVLKTLQRRFAHILIDEFQDTNYAQFQLVRLLAEGHENVTVVGDDDQSIYKFRGAAISNILSFREVYPQARQIVLTRNYRSTQVILDAAYRLIVHNNPDRLEVRHNIDKRLEADNPPGKPVRHLHHDTVPSESEAVAMTIEEKVSSGQYAYGDFAILVRSNNDAEPFRQALNMRSIPHTFSGSRGLYDREEVRLLVFFLRAVADPDDSMSLYYLAASEIYHMDMADLTRCMGVVRRHNRTLRYVLSHHGEFPELDDLSQRTRADCEKLLSDLDTYTEACRDLPTGTVLYRFLTESGYLRSLTYARTPAAELKIRNMARFFSVVSGFSGIARKDSVPEFVAHLDLLIESGDDPSSVETESEANAVHLLTVHKAKGLEFPVVFLVSLVQGKFPHTKKSESLAIPEALIKEPLPEGDVHLQEERRLFYVGMTRAMKELYLTSARDYGGTRARKVSQFVMEAMDKPRADETYVSVSPLEAIHRHAALPGLVEPEASTIPDEQVLHLTPTHVDDYLTCPLKYKYIHILRIPIMIHHSLVYGTAIHEAIREYHRRKLKGMEVIVDDLFATFERMWRSEGFLTREHEEQRLDAGRQTLQSFFAEQEKSGLLPTYVEEEFAFLLGPNKMTGRWDRVDVRDGQAFIIDFKTSEIRGQSQANRRARESLQLDIYALAYSQVHGQLPEAVELHFIESGLVGQAHPTPEKMEKTTEKIDKAARGIRSRIYTATPEYRACQFCPYSNICPETASE